eukprot:10739880-Karenia_brevis.AAC.1
MVAIVQQIPSRKVAQSGHLVISRPRTQDHLEAKGDRWTLRATGSIVTCVDRNGPRANIV